MPGVNAVQHMVQRMARVTQTRRREMAGVHLWRMLLANDALPCKLRRVQHSIAACTHEPAYDLENRTACSCLSALDSFLSGVNWLTIAGAQSDPIRPASRQLLDSMSSCMAWSRSLPCSAFHCDAACSAADSSALSRSFSADKPVGASLPPYRQQIGFSTFILGICTAATYYAAIQVAHVDHGPASDSASSYQTCLLL